MLVQGTNRLQLAIKSLEDEIAWDNPVRLIDALVEQLDLSLLKIAIPKAMEGRPAFHPKVFLKLYYYGYMNGIRSSRKLEKECVRNMELRWLLESLRPNYHSIADFRKHNGSALKEVFKMVTAFLKDQDLIEGITAAIDGSKFRAVNSSKNNYNAGKIKRHQQYLDNKTDEYLEQLEANDKTESGDELKLKREVIEQKLKSLKERKIKYAALQEQLTKSNETQVSTTDPESRLLLINHKIVEVSYNVQTVSDEKHSLVTHFEVTNRNDKHALHKTALEAKAQLQSEALTVLADKGYHTGEQLAKCEKDDITTIVSPKESSSQNPDENYAGENFTYDEANDTYTCPKGQTLTTNGNWYDKSHEDKKRKNSTKYKVKHYKTTACLTCPVMQLCTKNKRGRQLERSEHQEAVNRNNQRFKAQFDLYRRRQELIEHIFGTVKRAWGYTYTLMKGKQKIDGEFSIIYTAYNLTRAKNILGFEKLLKAIKNWTPKYPESPGFLLLQLHYIKNKPLKIFNLTNTLQKMAA
jgi:transposase